MGNRPSVRLINNVNNMIRVTARPTTGTATPAKYSWDVTAQDQSVQPLDTSWKNLTGNFNAEIMQRNPNGQWIYMLDQEVGPFDQYTITENGINGENTPKGGSQEPKK